MAADKTTGAPSASVMKKAVDVLPAELVTKYQLKRSYVTLKGQVPDRPAGEVTLVDGIWVMQNPNIQVDNKRVRSVIATSNDPRYMGVNLNMNTQGLVAHARPQLAKINVQVKGPGDTIGYPFEAVISVTPTWVQGRVDAQSDVALEVIGTDGQTYWTWGIMHSAQPLSLTLALAAQAGKFGTLEANARSEGFLLAANAPTSLARIGGSASGNADWAGFTIE